MIDIDKLRQALGAVQPEEVEELLDRLEAAESARRDNYQNWMTALDRNAELLAKLEGSEKERDKYKTAYNEWCEKSEWIQEGINNREISPKYLGWHLADIALDLLKEHKEKCEQLRSKIAEMEKQEPVVWMQSTHLSSFKNRLCGSQSSYVHCSDHQLYTDFKPLYALPGAQPHLNEIRTALQRALELGRRETWTGAREHRSREDQREEQQCWNKVWSLLGAQGEEK